MRNVILLLLISILLSCKTKKNNPNNEPKDKEIPSKLTGKQAVTELEKLGLFTLTDKSEIQEVKTEFEKSYTELNFFQGKTRGETLKFMDNRYYWIDSEELFEIGGLTEYLNQIETTFKRLKLKLVFSNEKSEQTKDSWKHTIELNGNEYSAFDGQFSDMDWGIAYVNFIQMLNAELTKQGSNEQFYPVCCKNDVAIVLLTLEQFNLIKKIYPDDSNRPTTIDIVKTNNGI